MKLRSSLLGLAIAVGLGLTAAACGDDNNHAAAPAPADYSTFKDLVGPDGDTNNGSAYDSLFH